MSRFRGPETLECAWGGSRSVGVDWVWWLGVAKCGPVLCGRRFGRGRVGWGGLGSTGGWLRGFGVGWAGGKGVPGQVASGVGWEGVRLGWEARTSQRQGGAGIA